MSEKQKEPYEQQEAAGHKKTKPDSQRENVNHNTRKVSMGPNTKR
jgi:hypothetical protein